MCFIQVFILPKRVSDGLALIYNFYLSSLAFLVKHTVEFCYILLITEEPNLRN